MRTFQVCVAALMLPGSLALGACDGAGGGGKEAQGNTAAAAGAEDAGNSKAAIEQVEEAVLEGFKAKDVNRVAPHYAEDATVMMAGHQPANGGQSIRKVLSGFMGDPNFSLEFDNQTAQVAASGDLAYTRGTYNVSYTNPETKQKQTERGSYVSVFRKGADGAWKVVEDITTPGEQQQQGS